MPRTLPTPCTPFGVTLRDDLERFLPPGDPREEAILEQFSHIAQGQQGFPVHPTSRHDRIQQQDHPHLPPSRLRPLAHHGVLSLRSPIDLPLIKRELAHRQFTYVVVGGGTAGLVLARRLSEDPENTVLVLEAGPLQADNPYIEVPNMAGKLWGSDLDWQHRSVPQAELGQRRVVYPRGKLVGGCSTMNIAVSNRPPKEDVDAWEKLGNPGWNWKELLEYHKRSETFSIPTPALNASPSTGHDPLFSPRSHGHDGPVQVSYARYVGEQFAGLYDALREEGLKEMDPNAGKSSGVGYAPATVDPESQTRSSAEAAYLAPIAHRPNLLVLTNAQATSLLWSSSSSTGLKHCGGVSFVDPHNPEEELVARCLDEVILCGGTFNSPQLLELSGIGCADRLAKLGIDSVVDLPGVGENLQDHPVISMSFKLKPGLESLDLLEQDPAFAEKTLKAYSHLQGPLTQGAPVLAYLLPSDFLSPLELAQAEKLLEVKRDRYGDRFEIAKRERRAQFEVEKENYHKRAGVEITAMNRYLGGAPYEKGASYIGVIGGVQNALSRGHVHIKSADPLKKPEIDPRYLSHPLDVFHLAHLARYIHSLMTSPTGSMSRYIDLNFAQAHLPSGLDLTGDVDKGGEEEWEDWCRMHCTTEHHPVGTCAMLPREQGGVVDPELRVYGTENVRVADLSIVPLHVATHTQSTAYMIGEKCSDIVMEAQMKRREQF